MKCEKCGIDFLESELQDSHDIPKYMDGTDKDGRHWLCKNCHKEYETEVLRLACMILITSASESIKEKCRFQARVVCSYFFKKGKEGLNGTKREEN